MSGATPNAEGAWNHASSNEAPAGHGHGRAAAGHAGYGSAVTGCMVRRQDRQVHGASCTANARQLRHSGAATARPKTARLLPPIYLRPQRKTNGGTQSQHRWKMRVDQSGVGDRLCEPPCQLMLLCRLLYYLYMSLIGSFYDGVLISAEGWGLWL
jgi:hypothetical protein